MRYVGTTMRDAMTGYRKISRYQLESGTSWFGRLWQAFREKLSSSGHACIYRASLILFDPTIRVSTRVYVYTSAFAFAYSNNVYPLHARISFELILCILLFSMNTLTFYACN